MTPEKCNHPIGRRRVVTRRLHGEGIRVEICGVCGREVVNPEDAQRLLSRRAAPSGSVLDARRVVLALLGTYPLRPIINRIVLMKEAFLLEKEASREVGLGVVGLRFVPYDYGPYSKPVDDALRSLQEEGLVTILTEAQGQKETIGLTDQGIRTARELLDELSESQVEVIRRKRKGWDQLGYYGLLRKIYEEYPAYRSKSKIADRMKPSRRWT